MGITIYDLQKIFANGEFEVPIRWDGKDFYAELKTLYVKYLHTIFTYYGPTILPKEYFKVQNICNGILKAITCYFNGESVKAFSVFNERVYKKIVSLTKVGTNIPIRDILATTYRTRKVEENRKYARKDLFHVPFNLRNKVATNRYSIAGYPSLYLSSTIDLCLEEAEYDRNPGRYIVSRFGFDNGDIDYDIPVGMLELGVKPSDLNLLSEEDPKHFNEEDKKHLSKRKNQLLTKYEIASFSPPSYLLRYPIIAACSFMRVNKNDPFSVEYIIPQLLMQAIRMDSFDGGVTGIRYFSCSSMLASELGFNYVFPTQYNAYSSQNYCNVLGSLFKLTRPLFRNEYASIDELKIALDSEAIDSYNK